MCLRGGVLAACPGPFQDSESFAQPPQPMPLPFNPRKRLGQHFLADTNLALKIVDSFAAPPEEPVVEIGPGTGALTRHLIPRYSNLLGIEVDARSAAYLSTTFPGLRVVRGDVLDFDWSAHFRTAGARLHVIGNLPYNITSPILFALLRHRLALAQALVMVQREVAERLVAVPGTKAYGIPSVHTQLYATVHLLFRVPRTVFVPQPAVESAIIRVAFDKAEMKDVDHGVLQSVVRAAFGTRRKMLRNSLRSWTRDRGILLPDRWARLRAEDLAPGDYVSLARHIQQGLSSPVDHPAAQQSLSM